MVNRGVCFVLVVFCFCAAHASGPMRLIEFNETTRVWMNEDQMNSLIYSGKRHNFIDVTDFPQVNLNARAPKNFPEQPAQKALVDSIVADVDLSSMRSNLETLSNYFTRYYTSTTGEQAAQWIYIELVSIKGSRDDITVTYFENSFLQPSVIARIEGAHDGPKDVVILGSHLDSVGSTAGGRSPGADDDGSGTVCNLEAFRLIVSANVELSRPIEFHYYAGEEAGLLGSQAIASDYSKRAVDVYGMMQLDMTMYPGTAPAISPITDFTSPDLTAFVRILIDSYCTVGWISSKCGYGCSDHASWTRFGFASAIPAEAAFGKENPNIHTQRDVIQNLDFEHGRQFVILAVAHLVELANAPAS